MRESGCHVAWVLSGVEIGDMAAKAVGRGPGESPGHVTGHARQAGMRAHQREIGKPRMIEPGALPAIHPVAALAFG